MLTYSMACYSKTTSPEVFGDRPGIELEEDVDCRGPSQLPKDQWRPEDPPKLSNFALWEEDFHWYFDFESTEE